MTVATGGRDGGGAGRGMATRRRRRRCRLGKGMTVGQRDEGSGTPAGRRAGPRKDGGDGVGDGERRSKKTEEEQAEGTRGTREDKATVGGAGVSTAVFRRGQGRSDDNDYDWRVDRWVGGEKGGGAEGRR